MTVDKKFLNFTFQKIFGWNIKKRFFANSGIVMDADKKKKQYLVKIKFLFNHEKESTVTSLILKKKNLFKSERLKPIMEF